MSTARVIIETDEKLKAFLKRRNVRYRKFELVLKDMGFQKDGIVPSDWKLTLLQRHRLMPNYEDPAYGVEITAETSKEDTGVGVEVDLFATYNSTLRLNHFFKFHPDRVTYDMFVPMFVRFVNALKQCHQRYHYLPKHFIAACWANLETEFAENWKRLGENDPPPE